MSPITPWSAVKAHFAWQYQLLNYFLSHQAKTMLAATASRIAAQFSQLFSLFFPLKIILVLGSNTVPVFLQGSMTMETRGMWIAGLAIATLILYVAAVALDLISNRLARRGGSQLARLPTASKAVPKSQRKHIKELFGIVCHGYANMAVFVVGAVGLLLLSPIIFLAMGIIMAMQLLIINGVCAIRGGWLGRLGAAIIRAPANYLRYLAAINFLCVFVLLMVEYLLSGKIEPVTALLTLLLARKMFQSLGQFAALAVRLEQSRSGIVNDDGH